MIKLSRSIRSLATAAALLTLAAPGCVADATETGDPQDLTQGTGRFETFKGADKQVYFQLIAVNGEPLLRSEGYTTLANAKKGIVSAQKNGVLAAQFEIHDTDDGEAYFNLVAANHAVLATSETYASRSNATRAVNTAIRTIKTATVAAAATGAKFETWKGEDARYYFHLRAANGQIVLQSQGYSSKSAAEKGTTAVKASGVDASNFDLSEGVNGQHYFRLLSANHQILGRSEMYVSKSGAIAGASTVRDILRKLVGVSAPGDAAIQAEIEKASVGLTYMSESDYPFGFVIGNLPSPTAPITEAIVRSELGSYVAADPDADKPMSELVGMSATWQTWKDQAHNCSDPSDPDSLDGCNRMRNLEQVLESNLKEIQVFYFGANGAPGDVEGIGVSIFIVGKSPSGKLVGVRTLAIWT